MLTALTHQERSCLQRLAKSRVKLSGSDPKLVNRSLNVTRKLNYRKDDRAMRPMYGCPENFRESLTTPMATFL